MSQNKQTEWHKQWSLMKDDELFLFKDWILPFRLEDFSGKEVLECGCGGGQHTAFMAPYAKLITAVDLNTIEIAKERTKKFQNVVFVEEDIANMDLKKQFDVVISIGVVHHTDNPDKTYENLCKHLKIGGTLILWVYSKEGNFIAEKIVEPLRKNFLSKMKRERLLSLAKIITFFMYIPVYSLYFLPLYFLPYYEYFKNFRKLSFYRNTLNVFDKLNAPQVQFIDKKRINDWFKKITFAENSISRYKNVSWRISAIK